MICAQCRAENADGSRFCEHCGAALGPLGERPAPAVQPRRLSPVVVALVVVALFVAVVAAAVIGIAGTYFVMRAKPSRAALPVEPAPAGKPQPPLPSQPQWPTPPTPRTPSPTPAAMLTYQDPQGRFTMGYPQGWEVQPFPVGTYFYQDDPEEGVSVLVVPDGRLEGELHAAQVIQVLVGAARRARPDLQIVSQQIVPRSGPPVTVEQATLTLTWTNVRRDRMQTVAAITIFAAAGSTGIVYWGAQAPQIAFESLQPTFVAMAQSYVPAR